MSAVFTAVLVAIVSAAAVPALAKELYQYRDRWGMLHIVDSLQKVPPEYQDKAEQVDGKTPRRGSFTVQESPVVNEKPAAPAAPKPVLRPDGRQGTFDVMRFRIAGEKETASRWEPSTGAFRKEPFHVVVAASWCPHCIRLIDEISRNPALKAKVDGILFYEDEVLSREKRRTGVPRTSIDTDKESRLVYPAELAAYGSLPMYFIRPGTFGHLVRGFPTILRCERSGCRQASRNSLLP
ncbi:MAG: hypothetical protein KIT79_00225 [Deltaproteobacteria bacterium]|nr:hypothetical protein [Deltaproteobacteria bacterium]